MTHALISGTNELFNALFFLGDIKIPLFLRIGICAGFLSLKNDYIKNSLLIIEIRIKTFNTQADSLV